MTCPTCGTENDAGQKFCGECGTRLALACPACGTAGAPGQKFCGECGTGLGGVAADADRAAPAPTAAEAEPQAERRLVTILFADLVGFTPYAEGRDAEDVRETLIRYFDTARDVIERYGGTVEKFIGDAVMAVWGAPVAREDDAERAVRSALELVEAVGAVAPGIRARAGVLTGEAAVTLGAVGEGMVAGDLVNTAARIQSVAEPGAVLVGEATMRSARAAITFEAAGEPSLKGKSAPVPVWRALRIVAERGGRRRSEALEAPFVGRDVELRLLKDYYHATTAERRLRLISITGQAGIGKSRLAWEFEKYLDGLIEPVYWHHGRSPAYGNGITFWALGEMVRGRLGLAEGDDEATTRTAVADGLARWIPDDDERRWVEPAILQLLGAGDAERGHEQLFGAWRTLFERISDAGTVVLVFEDLQWADAGLLAFLDHLAEWSRSLPIYVLTMARPELLDRHPDWGAGKRNVTAVNLEPLSATSMRELLAGLVPGLPDGTARRIVARADGVPLYAVETVRMLVAEGRLVEEDGAYRPSGDLSDLAVPETLQSLIGSRLDALEPSDRALLQAAAVLGQSFSTAALAATTETSAAELDDRLRALVRREVLVHHSDARSPERGQYAFVQSLVREVAYGTLARRDRKARHLAAARYFESLDDVEMAAALAAQYVAAHDASPDGAERDAVATQARIALKAAADRAAGLGSLGQAADLLEQAVELTTDPAERAHLLERAGANAAQNGQFERAERVLPVAIEAYRRLGNRAGIARASIELANGHIGAQRMEAARRVVDAAIAEVGDMGDEPDHVRLLAHGARVLFLVQDHAAAIEAVDRTLPLAERLDLVDVVAELLVTRGTSLAIVGRSYEGVGVLEAGMRLATAVGLVNSELRARINLSGLLANRDPRAAIDIARDGVTLATRVGAAAYLPAMVGNVADLGLYLGLWTPTVADLQARIASGGDPAFLLLYRQYLVPHLVELGRETPQLIDDLIADFEAEVEDGEVLVDVLRRLVVAYRFYAADRYLDVARELIPAAEIDHYNAANFLALALEGTLLARDLAQTEDVLARLRGTASHEPMTKASIRLAEAGLAGLRGDRARAIGGFVDLAGWYRDMGVVRLQAISGVIAVAILGLGDPEVVALAEASREILERVGGRPWIRRLDGFEAEARERGEADPPIGQRAAGRSTAAPLSGETASA